MPVPVDRGQPLKRIADWPWLKIKVQMSSPVGELDKVLAAKAGVQEW